MSGGLARSIWNYLITERLGYRRHIEAPADDSAEREAAIARVDQLERAIEMVYREQVQMFHERAQQKRNHR